VVKVVVKRIIKEGNVEEVIKLYGQLVEATRKEEGCIKYELFQDEKKPEVLAMIEEWESKEHLEKHLNSEHIKTIGPMIAQHTQNSEFNIYNKLI
jgi:quinol monooxygenase YgiN